MQQLGYALNKWCKARDVGRTRAYEEIKSGRLETYKVGRKRFVSATADAEWQRRCQAETVQPMKAGA